MDRSRYNIVVAALAFAVLFSSYNTLQNYATTLFPGNLGAASLGLLYAVAGVSVFAGPALTNALGPRAVMVGGAACYVVYLASLVWLSVPLVLATSVVIGFGAAVLWIALGVHITENSTAATYATNTGLFWSIFQLNNIVGNLTTYLVISRLTSSSTALYLGFAVVAALGTAGLLLLKPAERGAGGGGKAAAAGAAEEGSGGSGGSEGGGGAPLLGATVGVTKSLAQHLAQAGSDALKALQLLGTPNMLLLLPVFFFSGAELAFWTGEFPLLLSDSSMANIGLVLTFAGVGEVLGGLTMGKLSDGLGRSASLLLSVALYGTALFLTCQLKLATALAAPLLLGSPVIAFVAAFLFGLADSGFNTNACVRGPPGRVRPALPLRTASARPAQTDLSAPLPPPQNTHLPSLRSYAMCSQLYSGEAQDLADGSGGGAGYLSLQGDGAASSPRNPRSSVGAFTVFQLVQNAGSALWYLVSLRMPVHDAPGLPAGSFQQVWVQCAFLVALSVTFVAVDRLNRR